MSVLLVWGYTMFILRGRSQLVSTLSVCKRVVIYLVLIVDEYYPSRLKGCVHEDVVVAVCFCFLWLRITGHKTMM